MVKEIGVGAGRSNGSELQHDRVSRGGTGGAEAGGVVARLCFGLEGAAFQIIPQVPQVFGLRANRQMCWNPSGIA